MKLYTKKQYQKLISNGQPENRNKDHIPVIHLYFPEAGSFLITELNPIDPNIAFGISELKTHLPELAYIDLKEIATYKSSRGSSVEISSVEENYPISVYMKASKNMGYLVKDEDLLEEFV